MSADGSITLTWADGEHKFRLAIGQLRELQEHVNRPRVAIGAEPIGPRTLLRTLASGDGWPDEVREVIRLGLIGGGMSPLDALSRVKRYVDERPLIESAPVATSVLTAALVGVPDDIVGKKDQAEETKTEETTASSSPQSTGTEQPSDGAPTKSTPPPSGSSARPSTDGPPPTGARRNPSRHLTPNSTR